MKNIEKYPLLAVLIVIVSTYSPALAIKISDVANFSIAKIICPNPCRGERLYQIVFTAPQAIVVPDRGTIKNDTIADIDPQTTYTITVRITNINDGTQTQHQINLPICDPIIPAAPLVTSQVACANEPLPALQAFGSQNAAIDWYSAPVGGNVLAVNTTQFVPTQEGIYYAQARFLDSNCVSISRTPASLQILKQHCILLKIQKQPR